MVPDLLKILSPSDIQKSPKDIAALDDHGRPVVLDAAAYAPYSAVELAYFCVQHGLYGLPTTELVAWLAKAIEGRTAIEIGAGHGSLAAALQIPAVDNKMQTWPEIAAHYAMMRQAVVPYGPQVIELDAVTAIKRFQPQVVIASWVTHKFDDAHPEREGNMFGVQEEDILAHTNTYIHIGNSSTHRNKPIRARPHRVYRFPWLMSRALHPELNEISVWGARLAVEP